MPYSTVERIPKICDRPWPGPWIRSFVADAAVPLTNRFKNMQIFTLIRRHRMAPHRDSESMGHKRPTIRALTALKFLG